MGILTNDTRQKVREQNKDIRKEIADKTETIQGKKIQAIRDRHDKIREQVDELIKEKDELLTGPISKVELLTLAKEQYAKHRKEFAVDGLLKNHLAACQKSGRAFPFEPTEIKVHSMIELNLWRLFFLVFTPKDIEEVIATLPDIGISTEEREKKIKEIYKKVKHLTGQLDEELNEK